MNDIPPRDDTLAHPPTAAPASRRSTTTAWVNSTYFAEGYPFMLVRFLSGVFFTQLGVKERYLGYLNFLGVPWNWKFLWAPLLDLFGTKRRWLIAIEAALTVGLLVLAIAVLRGLHPWFLLHQWLATTTGTMWLYGLAFGFIALAFLSATHDIAIDAYYLTMLTRSEEQALYTGDRVIAYRIAVVVVRSGLVAIAALCGWFYGWLVAAGIMATLWLAHAWLLPRPVEDRKAVAYVEAFRTYLAQPRVALVLAFIITYKLGDEIMFSMNTAFLLRELHLSPLQFSWIGGTIGVAGTIVGSLIGAVWIARKGLQRAIWPLTLLMNINIWAYIALAHWKPDPATSTGVTWIAIGHGYEQAAAALGNAVLMTYLMRTCNPSFKAAHYAIGSALMSIGSTLFGGFGGVIVEHVGYVGLYFIGFAATLPAMSIIPFIPYVRSTEAQ